MLDNHLLYHCIVGLTIIAVSAIVGRLLKLVLNRVVRRIVAKTETELDDRIIDILGGKVTTLSVIGGVAIALQEVRKALTVKDVTGNQVLDYLGIVLFIVSVFVVTHLLIRVIEAVFGWYMEQLSRRTATNVAATMAPLTNRIVNIALFLVALIVALDHFGVNIGSLLVSLGVASLAIALAAQDTLANMIAGFVIIVDRPFRLGDRIQLPSSETGDVYEIGLRSTRILDFDNNLIVVPNAELVKSRIVNYSYPQNIVRVLVDIGIAYDSDLDLAKRTMIELAQAHPDVLAEPMPEVFLMDVGESALRLRLTARTDDFKKKFKIETIVREQIYRAFEKAKIEIPYPHRVVHVVQSSDGSKAPQTK